MAATEARSWTEEGSGATWVSTCTTSRNGGEQKVAATSPASLLLLVWLLKFQDQAVHVKAARKIKEKNGVVQHHLQQTTYQEVNPRPLLCTDALMPSPKNNLIDHKTLGTSNCHMTVYWGVLKILNHGQDRKHAREEGLARRVVG
jgi:hypothetical protein